MATRSARNRPLIRDWHLWAEVRRTVTPLDEARAARLAQDLAQDFVEVPARGPATKPPPKFDKHARWSGPTLPPYVPPVPRQRREAAEAMEPRIKRRLRRGQIEIDATLDLHGLRQEEARSALRRFVPARAARGDRTLLVITGKGLKKTDDLHILDRGVLRAMLPVWLREPDLAPLIAGWDAAAQGHGGEGAFYVRLRRLPA